MSTKTPSHDHETLEYDFKCSGNTLTVTKNVFEKGGRGYNSPFEKMIVGCGQLKGGVVDTVDYNIVRYIIKWLEGYDKTIWAHVKNEHPFEIPTENWVDGIKSKYDSYVAAADYFGLPLLVEKLTNDTLDPKMKLIC